MSNITITFIGFLNSNVFLLINHGVCRHGRDGVCHGRHGHSRDGVCHGRHGHGRHHDTNSSGDVCDHGHRHRHHPMQMH